MTIEPEASDIVDSQPLDDMSLVWGFDDVYRHEYPGLVAVANCAHRRSRMAPTTWCKTPW